MGKVDKIEIRTFEGGTWIIYVVFAYSLKTMSIVLAIHVVSVR
jgi:hypothetical protein